MKSFLIFAFLSLIIVSFTSFTLAVKREKPKDESDEDILRVEIPELIENDSSRTEVEEKSYAESEKISNLEMEREEYELRKNLNLKDYCDDRADPEFRKNILKEALDIFRGHSGKRNATRIDWKLVKVRNFPNQILPFFTDLKTIWDINNLKNCINLGKLEFLDLSKLYDRRIRAYERLYSIYARTTMIYSHRHKIMWDDVVFTGLPEGLNKYLCKWTQKQISEIESKIDKNAIKCELSDNIKKRINKIGTMSLDLPNSSITSNSESISFKSGSSSSLLRQSPFKLISKPIDNSEKELKTSLQYMVMLQSRSPHRACFDKYGDGDDEDEDDPIFIENDGEYYLKDKETKSSAPITNEMLPSDSKYVPNEHWEAIHSEQSDEVKISISSSEDCNIQSFEFPRNPTDQLLAHQISIQNSIANYVKAKEAFGERSRHRRIMNYIIQCLELILNNVRNFDFPYLHKISIDDIHVYLNVFLESLLKIGRTGDFEYESDWKKLIITTVKFRARLARNKYVTRNTAYNIPKGLIANVELFGFLSGSITKWNFALLDQYIDDNEEISIFKKS